MLVLRTSNLQGATIRPILFLDINTLLSLLFTTKFSSAHLMFCFISFCNSVKGKNVGKQTNNNAIKSAFSIYKERLCHGLI